MRSKFKWIFALLLAFSMQFSFAQEKTISGTITDGQGLPLPGVNVVVKGTARGTQTDFDGKYSISASQGEVLQFSFVGYKTSTATIGASSVVNMAMQEGDEMLNEVIVTGYTSTKRPKSLAAVNFVSIDEVEERSNASVIQNLQGMVAGLNIGTGSGQPGADSTILLRGVGSINGNIEPLFIVDGMPVDEDGFRSINQNDIASIAVLKDAAATSIYGNRGANGVIVINTKSAKFGQSLEVKYRGQYGITELQKFNIDVMNSRQILEFQKKYNDGLGSTLTDAEIAEAALVNTNWRDVFFRTGVTQQHDISFSSGSKNSRNFTSIGFMDQDGIFINTNFKRFNFRNNFNGKSDNEKFTYASNINVNFSRSTGIDGAGSNATFFAPFTAAIRGLPYVDSTTKLPYNDVAALSPTNAPLVLLDASRMNTDVEDELKILANFNADYKITDNFTAGINLGVDYSTFNNLEILDPLSLLGPFQVDARAQFGGIHDESTSRDFRFNSTTYLKYNKVFNDKHSLNVGLYTEYYKAHYNGFNFQKRGLDPRLTGTGSAFVPGTTIESWQTLPPYIPTIGSFKVQEGLFSYFGQADYDYAEKYGLSVNVRRDASFRFANDNKWGTFWSVAGRWNIDQESFMEGSAFNMLKLRGSYGTSGNQRVDNAQYSVLSLTRTLFGAGTGYNGTTSTVLTQLANPNVQWEEIAQTNVGLDFGIWQNKLNGSLDVYKKETTKLYQSSPISPVQGTSSISTNTGSLENKGIELTLNYNIFKNQDWDISVGGNGSYNKNKIKELPASTNGLVFGGGSTALGTGEPIGSFYVVRYAGVNPANGNPLFRTADGGLTETITDANRVFTGKSQYPVWQGGFNTSITYKGFNLYTQWSFVADIYRNNLDLATLETGTPGSLNNGGNRSTTMLNAWQNPGDITSIPRVGQGYNEIDYINSTDRYLEDASYLRLRNIKLSYNFTSDQLSRTFLKGLGFFIQAENIVTFSSWRGWDPESNFRSTDRGQYPTPKIFTFGTSINF
ncbi:SusC/RagA family TonB-linked outer membrane protein [Flavobacterium lindanitolerans]|uniref:TonB-linked SusC/RagA family outer membrane protein n=1 Tax=Flavobacterium lindanitolerans TaxID=428988 RepID=A0A497UVD0_9FLAO|nr:TonB-dependent receptor [Flavobacterium lindanitolerans]PKW29569.1 TonB-linked SusC/RagA family outer membrane protein [Flavobacterium lindanitolerans]RLJ34930.1 TonB-linked SusC/RagA family outer membrane protein [Flavobacterium lindanitolerans]